MPIIWRKRERGRGSSARERTAGGGARAAQASGTANDAWRTHRCAAVHQLRRLGEKGVRLGGRHEFVNRAAHVAWDVARLGVDLRNQRGGGNQQHHQ